MARATASVLASSWIGKEGDFPTALPRIEEVKEAHNVYGDYDIFIKTETSDLDSLNDVLIRKVRAIQSISTTTTMICL